MINEKKATVDEYNKMAEKYDVEERSDKSIYPLRAYIHVRELRALNLIGNIKNKKVLDAGTGTGRFALKLAKMGCETFGVEISKGMLLKAKEKAKEQGLTSNLHLVLGDCENLPFIGKTFDLVMSMTVINHLPNPNKAMEEISRVLKTKGTAIVSVPNIFSLRGLPYVLRVIKEKISKKRSVRMCAQKFTPWKLWLLHKNAGLKILKAQGVVWMPLPPKLNYKTKFIKTIEKIEKFFDKIQFASILAGTITVKSIKKDNLGCKGFE
jgi:ubiquinone/menaquinone biosynthesis C-methylase UbiE